MGFRIAGGVLLAAAVAGSGGPTLAQEPTLATLCDTLAADPYDPARVAPGVRTQDLRLALPPAQAACEAAVLAQPDEARVRAYLARTLRLAGKYDLALAEAHNAAQAGSVSAIATLGLMTGSGYGTPVDGPRALGWLQQAVEAHHGAAENNLAVLYYEGKGGLERNYEEAVKLFQRGATHGSPQAQVAMSSVYNVGWLREKDPEQSFAWALTAARQGNVVAQALAAQAYYLGIGVAKNLGQALLWARQAAQAGEAHAQTLLGLVYVNGQDVPQDYAQAMHWYQAASGQGMGSGAFNVGLMYANGEGVARNDEEAMRWYAKALEQHYFEYGGEIVRIALAQPSNIHWLHNAALEGNIGAQLALADMYEFGHGVAKNQGAAAQWNLRAAQLGDSYSQRTMALRYRLGQGLPKDPVQEALWARKAAEQGDATAQLVLGMLYELGSGVPQDGIAAHQWYLRAAEHGSLDARLALARLYHAGYGTPQDDIQACVWASLAAVLGHAESQAFMETLRRSMPLDAYQHAQDITQEWLTNRPELLGHTLMVSVEE